MHNAGDYFKPFQMYLHAAMGAAALAAATYYFLSGKDLTRALHVLTIALAASLFAFFMGQLSETSSARDRLMRVCKPTSTSGAYICDFERESDAS